MIQWIPITFSRYYHKSLGIRPSKVERRVSVGWKCTLLNVRNYWTYRNQWSFWWTRHTHKCLNLFCLVFTAFCKCEVSISNKRTSKANWKCTYTPGTVYTSIPAHLPDLSFQFFEGLVPRLNLKLVASFPGHYYQWPCPSLVPRPLSDFISQPWRKSGNSHGSLLRHGLEMVDTVSTYCGLSSY